MVEEMLDWYDTDRTTRGGRCTACEVVTCQFLQLVTELELPSAMMGVHSDATPNWHSSGDVSRCLIVPVSAKASHTMFGSTTPAWYFVYFAVS